jgi:pyroglutamyl-peptidase
MSFTILLTGFGPFPGAPYNPTGPLVKELAHRRDPGFAGIRRLAHVFPTSYAAVDRDLPALIARERPDIVLMFGLAARTRHLRIETRARNALSRAHKDAAGYLPKTRMIARSAPQLLPMRVPARRFLAAALATGAPVALSRDAGSYLCNYLCWRASEAVDRPRGPRLVAFIHVPLVGRAGVCGRSPRGRAHTLGDLIAVGDAILRAAIASQRARR